MTGLLSVLGGGRFSDCPEKLQMLPYEATKDGLPIGTAREIWTKVSGPHAISFWTLGKPMFL
ncbi:hypothetical protein [Rhizobium sp. NFR03]|uniref:hypothetical protein n=1 Tax=Rhizobium sp. NFR03 TaxID=1566263 RepID=UPI0011148CE1|nr:hypothetical protein [Rhizobium sp. NFR03]